MAEALRHERLPSGHDEEFVSTVEDDLFCVICQLPLKEPVLTRCGHRFCKGCLEEHLRREEIEAKPCTCPVDREILNRERDIFPDKPKERKIRSLEIECPSEGCNWNGELRNKEAHLETCPLKVVSCTNENCHVTVKRKDLKQHVTKTCQWRIIECKYCKESHLKCRLQDHMGTCSKFPVPCPNECGDSVTREMVPKHINDCPLTLVFCPYAQMGCIEKVQRKNVDLHLQSAVQEHLHFACVKFNNTQAQLSKTQETTRKLEEKVETLQKELLEMKASGNYCFTWKIKNFAKIKSQAIESDPFYTGYYKLKVLVRPYLSKLSISIGLMESEYVSLSPWPFKKKITVTLIDQDVDLKRRENVVHSFSSDSFKKRPTNTQTCQCETTLLIDHTHLWTRPYIVNDTLLIQVSASDDV